MLGTRIGNYVVRAQLGEGGMGTVYAAEHVALPRQAAIKVLNERMSRDPSVVARFFNEARAASTIHHPGIVEIYDSDFFTDGRAYIVMELLQGESLAARLARLGRIDERRAMLLVRQIAGALAAAHELGIVHRDLKPDNIFLVADPEVPGGERIKLLDFGIAKLLKENESASQTQTGFMLGTPAYMAPEQCRGSAALDGRADLYSLGAVLYELVCGRPPFGADGGLDVVVAHVYEEPPAPRRTSPALSDALDRLVLCLLRKDPDHRPQSAAELVREIDASWLTAIEGPVTPPDPIASAPTKVLTPPTTLSGAVAVVTRPPAPTRKRLLTTGIAAALASGLAIFAATKLLPARAAAPEPAIVQLDAAVAPPPRPVQVRPDAIAAPAIEPAAPATDWVQLHVGSIPAGALVESDRESTRLVVPPHTRRVNPTPARSVGDHGVNPFER